MRTSMVPAVGALLALLAVTALAGCASVQPWEKQNLSKPAMTFDRDRLEAGHTEHIYSSREAASGGSGIGGGGCGCN